MPEVGVAYPADGTSAEVITSRLRSAGIASRIDRKVLGTYPRPLEPSQPLLRLGVIRAAMAIASGLFLRMLSATIGR